MLSYNFRFAYGVRQALGNKRPKAFYQRHRRFVFAGVLLSWWTGIPFILEFNSSEKWTAKHWDPARFVRWLGLGEDLALAAASVIIVVSEALRQELLERGVPENKLLVNPNAVDPARFKPNSGGAQLRSALGIGNAEVLVSFAGSFSYWHGVEILEKAIAVILKDTQTEDIRIRFLLVGKGPLAAEMQLRLKNEVSSGSVIFTGLVPQDEVIRYLDASDILVSPHVPLPDGRPFFGSPTKLFEYMAMAKAIIASNLDQLASVIKDNETGMLVPPGDAPALAKAVCLLARTPALRERLGQNARAAAQRDHTWNRNAYNILSRL
jgi:glycosyltransferase involved in cell wall biosynthesis